MRTTSAGLGRVLGASMAIGALVLSMAVPAAAQVDTASAIDGQIEGCVSINVGTDTTGPGASAATINEVWQCQSQTNDERLDGDMRLIYNIAGWTDVGAIEYGWASIENDAGSWAGTWSSTVSKGGDQVILAWYQGQGEYEGWTYVETQQGTYQETRDTFGIVYPGDPPPSVVIVPPAETEMPVAE